MSDLIPLSSGDFGLKSEFLLLVLDTHALFLDGETLGRYSMWKRINNVNMNQLGIRWTRLPLNLSQYLFVNSKMSPGNMSTQLTGNTCYFQTYL